MASKTILVTGGAGYIGSHTVLQLLLGGFKTVVIDNLNNSSKFAIQRVKELAGEFGNNLSFHKVPNFCLIDIFVFSGIEPVMLICDIDHVCVFGYSMLASITNIYWQMCKRWMPRTQFLNPILLSIIFFPIHFQHIYYLFHCGNQLFPFHFPTCRQTSETNLHLCNFLILQCKDYDKSFCLIICVVVVRC